MQNSFAIIGITKELFSGFVFNLINCIVTLHHYHLNLKGIIFSSSSIEFLKLAFNSSAHFT